MPILLNGRELAAKLRSELKTKIIKSSIQPCLGVILAGNDPASQLYVSLKEKAAQEVGINIKKVILPAAVTTDEIIKHVWAFNQDADIHAILIQLPLPVGVDENKVITAMLPEKDADGFHPQNLTRFLNNQPAITPGVSAGIIKLIELSGQSLTNKQACLLVNSQEFALPLKKMLTDKGVLVDIIYKLDANRLREADIIVVAVGQPHIIKGQMIKDGAIVIDVGTTKINTKVVGDVDAASLTNRNVYLTPVPGGVGPMTIAMLLWNVYFLARRALEKGV